MKNKLLILCLIICCTGCSSIKYNIKFGDIIEEKISTYSNSNANIYIDESEGFYRSPFQSFFGYSSYNAIEQNNGNNVANVTFESMSDFIDGSIIFQKVLNSDVIKLENTKVKININSSDYIESLKKTNALIEVSLYIPYYVSSHNATNVSDNTYTWIIDDIDNAHVKIDFDMSKSYNYVNSSIYIYIIIGIFVIISGVVVYFIFKSKKNNEI